MDQNEIKQILEKQEEILELVHKLWKAEKWRRFWAIAKYTIFVIIIIGGLYFVQPYLGPLVGLLQNVIGIQKTIQQNPQDLQKILQQFQTGK